MRKEAESSDTGEIIVASDENIFRALVAGSSLAHSRIGLHEWHDGKITQFIAVDPLLGNRIADWLNDTNIVYRNGDRHTQIDMVRDEVMKIHQSRQEQSGQSNP